MGGLGGGDLPLGLEKTISYESIGTLKPKGAILQDIKIKRVQDEI